MVIKMRGHKYIRREPDGKGGYRYFYPNTSLSPDTDYDRRKEIDDKVNRDISNMSRKELDFALKYQKRNKVPYTNYTGDPNADKFYKEEYDRRLKAEKKKRQEMVFQANMKEKEERRKKRKELVYRVKSKYEALHAKAKEK